MTPFELRAQVLEMARDYLQKQYEVNLEYSKKIFDNLIVKGYANPSEYNEYLPKIYSLKDIKDKAKELYTFVETK